METIDPKDLVSMADAAVELGCTAPTLRRKAKERDIPEIVFPLDKRRKFYRRQDLEVLKSPVIKAA